MTEKMSRLDVIVPERLDRAVRMRLAEMGRLRKGELSKAVTEALEDWLKKGVVV